MNIPFIANHDTDRAAGYLTVASGRMAMAANLYILTPGSPFIYYGEEIGLRGSRGGDNTDANRRLAMLWGDGDTVQDPPGSTYDKQTPYSVKDLEGMPSSLLQHYRKLIALRKANPEIARGEYTALHFEEHKDGRFSLYAGRKHRRGIPQHDGKNPDCGSVLRDRISVFAGNRLPCGGSL